MLLITVEVRILYWGWGLSLLIKWTCTFNHLAISSITGKRSSPLGLVLAWVNSKEQLTLVYFEFKLVLIWKEPSASIKPAHQAFSFKGTVEIGKSFNFNDSYREFKRSINAPKSLCLGVLKFPLSIWTIVMNPFVLFIVKV